MLSSNPTKRFHSAEKEKKEIRSKGQKCTQRQTVPFLKSQSVKMFNDSGKAVQESAGTCKKHFLVTKDTVWKSKRAKI